MLRALKVSYSDVGEGVAAVNCEKTQFFLNTLYVNILVYLTSAPEVIEARNGVRTDVHKNIRQAKYVSY